MQNEETPTEVNPYLEIVDRMSKPALTPLDMPVEPAPERIPSFASLSNPYIAMQESLAVPAQPRLPSSDKLFNETAIGSLSSVMGINPDQAAEATKLGTPLGIGQDLALYNMDEVRQRSVIAMVQRTGMLQNNPRLAQSLLDPVFAAQAHDDLDSLAKTSSLFEKAVNFIGPELFDRRPGQSLRIAKVLEEGYALGERGAELGQLKSRRAMTLAFGSEDEYYDLVNDRIAYLEKQMGGKQPSGIFGTTAQVVAQGIVNAKPILTGALLGAATGGVVHPWWGAVGFKLGAGYGIGLTTAEIEGGVLYDDMVATGVDPETALFAAAAGGTVIGTIEAASDAVTLLPGWAGIKRLVTKEISEQLTKPTIRAAVAQAGKNVVLGTFGQGAEEGLQSGFGLGFTRLAQAIDGIESDITAEQVAKEIADSFIAGVQGGILLSSVGPGLSLMVDVQRAEAVAKQQEFFDGLDAAKRDGKLPKRNLDAYEGFLARQAKGTTADTVYVEAEAAAQVLAQSGLSVTELEKVLPGIREQLKNALENGGDITIPTAVYGAKLSGTQLGDALRPHMRLSPEAMSVAQAQEFSRKRDALRQEAQAALAERQEADAAFVESAQKVETTVAEQLRQTGMQDIEVRANAELFRDLAVTQAARMGITPEQFYERYPYRVRGPQAVQEGQPLEQADQFDQAGQRKTDTPEFREWNDRPTEQGGTNKLVDEQGQPLRFYHGTSRGGFTQFDPAFLGTGAGYSRGGFSFVTSREQAEAYAERASEDTRIVESMLAELNPLFREQGMYERFAAAGIEAGVFDEESKEPAYWDSANVDEGSEELYDQLDDWLVELRKVGDRDLVLRLGAIRDIGRPTAEPQVYEVYLYAGQQVREFNATPETIGNVLAGIDVRSQPGGAVIVNMSNGDKVVIVSDPTNIKSTDNRGTFSRATPNIFEQASRIDSDYIAAVERGDMETAQRMVDEAARSAGYEIGPVYHGSPVSDIEQFNIGRAGGIYFTDDPNYASGYGPNEYVVRLKISNMADLRVSNAPVVQELISEFNKAGGWSWNEDAMLDRESSDFNPSTDQTWEIFDNPALNALEFLKARGFDGAILKEREGISSYVVFSPEQIKSADPVVYDESGNVVPLSRRFDITSPKVFEQAAQIPKVDGVALRRAMNQYIRGERSALEVMDEVNLFGLVTEAEVDELLDQDERNFVAGVSSRGGGSTSLPSEMGRRGQHPLLALVRQREKERPTAIQRRDAFYLDAVQRDDIDQAEYMVDQAAYAQGYRIEAFHGTDAEDFSAFKYGDTYNWGPALYFSPNREYASEYLDRTGEGEPRVMRVKLRIDNMFSPESNPEHLALYRRLTQEARDEGLTHQEFDISGPQGTSVKYGNYGLSNLVTYTDQWWLVEKLWREGFDGFRTTEADGETVGIAVRDPSQVKLADPVTRDESGNVVPLSSRFDITSPKVFEQAARAPRGDFDPAKLMTTLREGRDFSTFAHETAHFYLTILADIARSATGPQQTKADMDALLSWFGIEGATPAERLAKWSSMTIDQQRQYHEQFAYSFEIYLHEGKAPSVELQSLFNQFAAWLKRVYKSIRDELNATYKAQFGRDLPMMSSEIRLVMDRMLATDEQIARAQAVRGMKALFQTQEQSGMNDAEWAAYQALEQDATDAATAELTKATLKELQWYGNAQSRYLREMQAKHDRARKEIREEVSAQVQLEPVYRAMELLKRGIVRSETGETATAAGISKLDLATVKAMMPADFDPASLKYGKYGMVQEGGLHPDIVAEVYGFGSGVELINAILAAKPIKEEIDARTDQRMLEENSDLATPEARQAAVDMAIHNDFRARIIAVEQRWLEKSTRPVNDMLQAARQVAQDIIGDVVIRTLNPRRYEAAEAEAARTATTAYREPQDPSTAGQAAATRAYNEAIAAGRTPDEATVAATEAGVAAVAKARERRAEFNSKYGGREPAEVARRAKRQQLVQNQLAREAMLAKEEIDKQVKYLRRVLRDTNVKRMGAEAADQIAQMLERFEVARVSIKRLDERKALSAYLAAQEEAGLVPDIAPEIANEARRINYREMTVNQFRDLVDAVRQIEHVAKYERKMRLAQELADFEENRDGIVARIRAVAAERGLQIDPRTPLTNIGRTAAALRGFAAQHLKAASIVRILDGGEDDGPLWNAIVRTANDASNMETTMRSVAARKIGEILKPVFALGNMGGKGMFFSTIQRSLNREARIAIAMNVGNDGNRQRLLDGEGWTMEQIQPILESLTEAEWLAVQAIWDFIDGYRPEIAAKWRRLYGKEPQWVEPVPFTVRTADGKNLTLQGGYYPIKYDPVASDRVATIDAVEEAKRDLQGSYTAATTRRSFTKQRATEVVGRPLLYTLDAAFTGVNDVIHDLAWHEWLISTQRLLRNEKFANAVRETRGPEFLKQLRDWAKDNATGGRGQQAAGEAVLSWLRQGISASGLGFNVVSAAMQITGFNQSIIRVGAKYIGWGITEFVSDIPGTAKRVAEKDPFMAERGRTQFREINEIKNRVRGQTDIARRVTSGTYFLMMTMQRAVDIPTWLGAYQKALDAGKDDATAVALAGQAVRDSQGSGLLADLAAVERGGPAMKLFTVFYSYMNTVYNMAAVQTMTARGRGKLAADYVMLFVVPVVLGYAIKNALQPEPDDEEFDPEALARDLAAAELEYMMGTMIIVREFSGASKIVTGAEGVRMGYSGPAGLRLIGEAYTFTNQAAQLEFDRAFRKSAINLLGALTGIPSAQINRTIDGIDAVVEEEVEGGEAVLAPLTGVKR